jgi:hypothetical protein
MHNGGVHRPMPLGNGIEADENHGVKGPDLQQGRGVPMNVSSAGTLFLLAGCQLPLPGAVWRAWVAAFAVSGMIRPAATWALFFIDPATM